MRENIFRNLGENSILSRISGNCRFLVRTRTLKNCREMITKIKRVK